MAKRRRIQPEEKIPVKFSPRERELVLKHTLAEPELTDPLEAAALVKGAFVVGYTLEDLECLIGYVASEANHTEDKKLEKELDKLCDRLQVKMESYDDGLWQQNF